MSELNDRDFVEWCSDGTHGLLVQEWERLADLAVAMGNVVSRGLLCELATLRLDLAERDARIKELEGPGTLDARAKAMSAFAVEHCGHNPMAAKPYEVTIREHIESLESQLATMRQGVEHFKRAGIKGTQCCDPWIEGMICAAQRRLTELESLLATASYPGHYISTACQAGLHGHCRVQSKWAGEPCLCKCGHVGAQAKPTYQELESQLAEARRDTQRLDWIDSMGDIGRIVVDEDLPGEFPKMQWNKFLDGSIRKAIDDALASQPEPEA